MFKVIFILVILCPSAALAQTAVSATQRTNDILHQLALAGMAFQIDNMSAAQGLLTELPDVRMLVESLTSYGFRPDPEIGLAILLPAKSGRPEPEDLLFVAAHNSLGSPALCLSLSASSGVVPVQAGLIPETFNGVLNIYHFDPAAPKGSKISVAGRGLTYDRTTGLVTAAAP